MEDIDEIKRLELSLKNIINGTKILPDGRVMEIRYLVDQIKNIKIKIYPNEHPPPHFHVIIDNSNASLSIVNCELLKGDINSKNMKKIKYWHNRYKEKLIDTWNLLRPDDCPVGKIILNE